MVKTRCYDAERGNPPGIDVTYDYDADAAYVQLSTARRPITLTVETTCLGDPCFVDYAGQEIVGIEWLCASKGICVPFRIAQQYPSVAIAVAYRLGRAGWLESAGVFYPAPLEVVGAYEEAAYS